MLSTAVEFEQVDRTVVVFHQNDDVEDANRGPLHELGQRGSQAHQVTRRSERRR